jgi:hypothetical protein
MSVARIALFATDEEAVAGEPGVTLTNDDPSLRPIDAVTPPTHVIGVP